MYADLSPPKKLRIFAACFNTSLTENDISKVETLLEGKGFLPEKSSGLYRDLINQNQFLSDGTVPPAEIMPLIFEASDHGLISSIREYIFILSPPLELWSSLSIPEKERDLILCLFDGDLTQAKKWLTVYGRQHYLTTPEIIRKVFGRHFSEKLLNHLPPQISIILARQELSMNVFNDSGFEIAAQWMLDSSKVSAEDKAVPSYILNKEMDFNSPGGKALGFWQKRNYSEVCSTLDKIEILINKGKVRKDKFSVYLAFIHILSRMKIANVSSADNLLKTYQNFFGDLFMFKCLEVLQLLNKGNFKKAQAKTANLQYLHKGSSGESFFMLLTKFWVKNDLSAVERKNLEEFESLYDNSQNQLMKFEINRLSTMLKQQSLFSSSFSHLAMAELLDNSDKWEELLEAVSNPQKAQQRLIWLLKMQSGTGSDQAWADIEPALQEKGRKEWKKPELISWVELLHPKYRELLSTRDKSVIAKLRTATETHGVDYVLPEGEALQTLAGAENLFFNEDFRQKIIINFVNPSVEIKDSDSGRIFSWDYPSTAGKLHIEEVEDFVYDVCSLSDELSILRDKTTSGIKVDNQQAFNQFLEALPDDLLIYSGDNIADHGSARVISSFKLVGRFHPAGQEYHLSLLAVPDFKGSESLSQLSSVPGKGRPVMTFKSEGKAIAWRRDKHEEGLIADDVLEGAGLDTDSCLAPYEWDITDKDQLLNVLEEFSQNPSVELQWPRGGIVKVSKAASGAFSVKPSKKRDWFQIDGKVNFGKKSIRLSKVIASLEDNSRFVRISDSEFIALSKELRSGLEDLKNISESKHDSLELHAALSDRVSHVLEGLPGDVEQDFIFRDCVTRMIYGQSEKADIPAGLNATLRPYQARGYKWLAATTARGVGACLADDMGLGKTVQTLALLLLRKEKGPSCIIAPTSLCHNWIDEAQKFAPELNMINYRGPDRDLLIKDIKAGDIIVASYAVVNQDIEIIKEINFNALVLDEAQMVKNSGTLRSKAIKLLQADTKVALSGTPVENHAGELWNLFDILNPGLLGGRSYFQKNYALPIEQGDREALQSLKEKVKPFILRRTRKKVLTELPDSQETDIYVPMTDVERELYDAGRYEASKKLKRNLDKKKRGRERIQILAEITRLRKLAANFELSEFFDEQSSKTKAVLNQVEELIENGHKALIFSQFVTHLNIFEKYFKEAGYSYTRLDGSMKQEHRKAAVETFNSGQRSLMLISLKAGGFGLNLTTADFVIHLDPWWNPAVEDQAAGRALRIGQTKKVNIIRFITEDSIESEILKMHTHKKDISSDILRGTGAASKMSVDDLVRLLRP